MLPVELWQLISEYCRLVEMKNRILNFEKILVLQPHLHGNASTVNAGTWVVLKIPNSKALYVLHYFASYFGSRRTLTYYPNDTKLEPVTFTY